MPDESLPAKRTFLDEDGAIYEEVHRDRAMKLLIDDLYGETPLAPIVIRKSTLAASEG